MKIVVAYKWAANPQEAVVSADGTVDTTRAKSGISEYDPVAIEVGRELADAVGAELVGLSVGGPDTASTMARKTALSRGLDRLVLITDPSLERVGAGITAALLASAVQEIGDVDLVLTGDCSVDEGAQLVPATLAGYLGWVAIPGVQSVRVDGPRTRVGRTIGTVTQTLELSARAVLAIAPDAATPRIPGMRDILASSKKPVLELPVPVLDLPSVPEVTARARPDAPSRVGLVIDGADPDAAATALVTALHDAGVL